MLQKVIRVASEIHTKNACKKRIKRITKTIAYKVSGVKANEKREGVVEKWYKVSRFTERTHSVLQRRIYTTNKTFFFKQETRKL